MAAVLQNEVGIVETSEITLERKLSEAEKMSLFQKLENFPCLWDSGTVSFKDKLQRNQATEELCEQFNLTPNNLKRILHGARTAYTREVKKEQDGQKSKWKFYEALSYMKHEVLQSMKVKEEREWNEEDTETLIQFYKENEALWNHRLLAYRDRSLKDLNFAKLNALLPSRTIDDIKKQWHVLKTIFCRELKWEEGSKVSGAGADSVYNSQWKFFKEMMFIKGSDDVDLPITSLEDHCTADFKAGKKFKAEKAKEMEEVKLDLYKEAIKCLRTPLAPITIEQERFNIGNQANDEISLFVKSLESTLKKFSARQVAYAKKRINDVVFDLEMESYADPQLACMGAVSNSNQQPSELPAGFAMNTYSSSLGMPGSNFRWT